MQLGGKRGCGNEREDLGKLFDPRWGLQGGSESFPDPPGCRVGCSGADGGGKGERDGAGCMVKAGGMGAMAA